MPVPKPRSGETQDDFISRCVSWLADDSPDMPNKQRVAICFSQWRDREQIAPVQPPAPNKDVSPSPDKCHCRKCGYVMENPDEHCVDLSCPKCGAQMYRKPSQTEKLNPNAHADFIQFYHDFINLYGEELGDQKYRSMLAAYSLDETQSYGSQLTRECLNGVCESFQWTKPLIQYLRTDKDAKYYKVRALTASLSANKNDYRDIEELERSARTLTWRPLNLNHNPLEILPFPDNRVDWAEFEDKAVEAIIRIHNNQKTIQDKLDNGEIVNPSIEGEPRGGHRTPDGNKVPKWYNFTALALLEKDKTLPGVPSTYGFEPLFLNESLGRSLVESLSMEKIKTKEKTLTTPEQVDLKEAEWTTQFINNLPNSSFAVVEPCADERKDARHLPYRTPSGVDLPHLRNALARMDQIKSVCGGSDEAIRRTARAKLIPLAKKHLPGSKWAQEKTVKEWLEEQGIQGMDICGQCKFYEELTDTTTQASAAPGSDATVTHSAGAIGPGIGKCSVTGGYIRKADPVCTDGRPRDQPTDLDRTIEMKEMELEAKNMVLTQKMVDLENQVLLAKQNTRTANEGKLTVMKESLAKDEDIKRLQNELAEIQSKVSRVSEQLEKERLENRKLGNDNDRLTVENKSLDEDLKNVKERLSRLQDEFREQKTIVARLEEDLKRATTKANDESALRAQAVQRAIDAENSAAEIQRQNALLVEQISGKSQEIYDTSKARSEGAKREMKLQEELRTQREEHDKLVEEIRDLKRQLTKLRDQKKIKVHVKT